MQKELSLVTKNIKPWIKKTKVIDVVLFGSSMRSKIRSRDVDLCILLKEEDEPKTLDLIASLGKIGDKLNIPFHITSLTETHFVKGSTLSKTLLTEGHSIIKNKSFAEVFGFTNNSLFVYSLKRFTPSRRVQFHYMLRGRYGSAGVLREAQGKFIGTGSIIVPTEKEDLFKDVLDSWGIKYTLHRLLFS